ncbi:hypothetical protein [Kingella sp. (in: b-proteobacteria)]|uniref:hypothetical protein n=1 Tax=Kingella sp. (in: b-proteobacteria) TaxID=2020713 RepID=UPI0026DC1389|nr:hypothetical protein [Kingella sp. (in: b-proteobacteria)]MDO4656302.1 hypothetical protein [Kingella sp. (in: b-proteobacteria)]
MPSIKGSLKVSFPLSGCLYLFFPEQAFRRLPRAGASPCTPPQPNHPQSHSAIIKGSLKPL